MQTVHPEQSDMADSSPKEGIPSSHQARALFRKSLSFQKRQCFTNCCCVFFCPILMILIAAALGTAITMAIQNSNPIVDVLYCSNATSLNEFNFPITNISNPKVAEIKNVPHAPSDTVKGVNYFVYSVVDLSGPSANNGAPKTCVSWFGLNYPNFSSIYEPQSNISLPAYRMDTLFYPQIIRGWIESIFNPTAVSAPPDVKAAMASWFSQYQLRPWSLIKYNSAIPDSLLGNYTIKKLLNTTQFTRLTADTFSPANASSGFLDTLEQRYFVDFGVGESGIPQLNGFQPVPYSKKTDQDLDDTITSIAQAVYDDIALVDKSAILVGRNQRNATKLTKYYAEINKVLEKVPYGATFLDTLDFAAKKFKWILQYGANKRISAASSFPSAGFRSLIQQTQLDNALLRYSNLGSTNQTRMAITQGIRSFPRLASTKIDIAFSGLIGRVLFPFGVSFLLPIFAVVLVKEKEDRILVMMKLNGLKQWVYVLSQYITFFVLAFISSMLFLIAGKATKIDLLYRTETGVIILVFIVWNLSQISLAFFFASFFSKSRTALVIVFLLVLCSVNISFVADQLFLPGEIPYFYFLWPPFAFYRALGTMNLYSYTPRLAPYKVRFLQPGDEVFAAILFLAFEAVIYLLLAFYIEAVTPSEFGVARKWNFPITELRNLFSKGRRDEENKQLLAATDSSQVDLLTLQLEDDDVRKERERVDCNNYDPNCPLVMKHMKKVYPPRAGLGPKIAVRDVSFAVEVGVVFGLLGPNGAGKTTLISILTGIYGTTSGEATIAGFNIKTQADFVNKKMGICPQFDILWDDLTVGEHLYFYCRLKGVPIEKERERVLDSLRKVSLEPFEDRLTKGLSGGEKRRLSIAIALVGDPSVVFLDEPTTGLDPEVRRLIWTIINTARAGKTIVLTTHSMEEAEALCQRIAIMSKGNLRCLANTVRLKQLYGSGFKLFFNSKAEHTEKASRFIESLLPKGWTLMDSFTTNTSYEFPAEDGAIARLFLEIEKRKAEKGIIDYGISQTTLEEVFLKLISEGDAQAD